MSEIELSARQTEAMARIATALATPDDSAVAAERVVDYAVEVSGAQAAVLLEPTRHGEASVIATTDELLAGQIMVARRLSGEGSTPEQWAARQELVVVDDLWEDPRWPRFGEVIRDLSPLRSALSVTLRLGDRYLGLLTLFDKRPGYFDAEVQRITRIYAQHATIALAAVAEHARAASLQNGLESNRLIGAATGVLMVTRHVSRDEAFALLRRASQNLNTKVVDVAEQVLWTGRLPDGG